MKRTAILAIALAMIACGGERRREKKAGVPVESPSTGEVIVRAVGGGGGGSSGRPGGRAEVRKPREELRLELAVPHRSYGPGSRIPATLTLTNVTEAGIRMYRPARSLAGDLRLEFRTPGGRKHSVTWRLRVPEESIRDEEIETLEPGASVRAEVDLGSVLRDAGVTETGNYRFTAIFTGGYQGRYRTRKLWNRARVKEVRSNAVDVSYRAPAREEKLPVDPLTDVPVATMLGDAGPDGRLREDAVKVLDALGRDMYPAMVRCLDQAASRIHPEQVVGWNAFRYLRAHGVDALEAIGKDTTARSPLKAMLTAWIRSEERARLKLDPDPEEESFRRSLADPRARKRQIFRLTRCADQGRTMDSVTLFGTGRVEVEHLSGGKGTAYSGTVSGKALDAFRAELVKGRFWLQRAVRRRGSEDEALLIFEQEEQVGDRRKPVRRFEVWEMEATFFNRSLSGIVGAFHSLAEAVKPKGD